MANAQRFRPLLSTLNDAVDETQQLVALQELAELLSMATEESLIGVDIGDFARVLINLGGGPSGDLAGLVAGNANVMLLACRCLSNLLEALPLSGSTLLRHGAVDMLCGRLLDIEYIDVAEQALSVLARISRDFAARVCEAGGLSACLMFLDFFASSTQHTALTCAVNCARAISSDQFAQAADAVPVLERTMFYSDPKTVELSCAALLHLVTAFRSSPERTERLVSADLLQRIVTSFRSGDSMHHDEASVALLRLLVVVATASRERAAQLLGMAIIPTVCDILSAQCVDPHVAFGAVDEARNTRQYRQRSAVRVPEPAWEALRLVLALLPRLPITSESLGHMEVFVRQGNGNGDDDALSDDCCLRLHAVYTSAGALDQLQNALLPLMVRVIASTINVSARYRAMLVILKVVLCLGSDQLRAALSTIDLPQFVVATLSLQSSLLLSVISLLTTRLVLDKLPGHYTRRFIREGVVDGLSRIVAAAESLLAAIAAGRRDSTDSEPTEENSGDDDNDDSINAPDSSNNTMDGDAEPLTLSAGFRLIDVHIPNTARHGT
ncbi:Ubiquitin fusion degradation protein 4, partial [Coemansia sp. RSA 2708]